MSIQTYLTIAGFAVAIALFFMLLGLRLIAPKKTYKQPSQANTRGLRPDVVFPESKVMGSVIFYEDNKPEQKE